MLFLRFGNVLQNSRESGLAKWAEAAGEGYLAIRELGGAKPGDRTMLDALDPFVRSLSHARENGPCETLRAAVEEARRGAEDTARMMPRMGRSSYLGDRVLGYPDPGAKAVVIWLDAVARALFPDEQCPSDAEAFDRQQLLTR